MYDENLKKFETHCNKCIFAQYDSDQQSGCDLGRLKTFEAQGRTRLVNNSYVINGVCNATRGAKWEQANKGLHVLHAVQKEIQVKMDMIILCIDQEVKLIEMERAINSCVKQTIKPSRIILIVKNSTVNYTQLYNTLQELISPYEISFRLVRVANKESDINECVNMAVAKCNAAYVGVFDYSARIPHNLIEQFNNVINEELKRVVMVAPEAGYSGMILQRSAFSLFGKNHNMPIFSKLQEAAEFQKNNEAIITWNQLWNQE